MLFTETHIPIGFNLQGPPPAPGFNLEGNNGLNQPTGGPSTEPVLLSPQQLPGYPSSPPEYTPYPSNFSNQPSPYPQPTPGYPQTQPGFSHQPGIQHNFPDAETQATVIPVVITVIYIYIYIYFVEIYESEFILIYLTSIFQATRYTNNRRRAWWGLFSFLLCTAIILASVFGTTYYY